MFSQASKTFMWQCDELSIAKATTFPKRPLIQNTKLLPSQITTVTASDCERFLMLNFLHLWTGLIYTGVSMFAVCTMLLLTDLTVYREPAENF